MFHITFVQIDVFYWLSGRQKGSIFVKMFKNLLPRNHMDTPFTQLLPTRVCFTNAGVNNYGAEIHKVRKHAI